MFRQIAAPGQLAGAVLLSLVFGSIHAFAALMAPLELALDASRAEVSLGYSLAIASLTCGVFAAPCLLHLPPARLAAISGAFAAGGLTVAAAGQSLPFLLMGYGLVFGFTNGIAYSLFLNRAAHAMPNAQGWSAGIVTATYGLGAAIFAQGFNAALAYVPVEGVLLGLAIGVAAASAIAAALFGGGSAQIGTVPQLQPQPAGAHRSLVAWLWLVYFLGAAGGLMVRPMPPALPVLRASANVRRAWRQRRWRSAMSLAASQAVPGASGAGRGMLWPYLWCSRHCRWHCSLPCRPPVSSHWGFAVRPMAGSSPWCPRSSASSSAIATLPPSSAVFSPPGALPD